MPIYTTPSSTPRRTIVTRAQAKLLSRASHQEVKFNTPRTRSRKAFQAASRRSLSKGDTDDAKAEGARKPSKSLRHVKSRRAAFREGRLRKSKSARTPLSSALFEPEVSAGTAEDAVDSDDKTPRVPAFMSVFGTPPRHTGPPIQLGAPKKLTRCGAMLWSNPMDRTKSFITSTTVPSSPNSSFGFPSAYPSAAKPDLFSPNPPTRSPPAVLFSKRERPVDPAPTPASESWIARITLRRTAEQLDQDRREAIAAREANDERITAREFAKLRARHGDRDPAVRYGSGHGQYHADSDDDGYDGDRSLSGSARRAPRFSAPSPQPLRREWERDAEAGPSGPQPLGLAGRQVSLVPTEPCTSP